MTTLREDANKLAWMITTEMKVRRAADRINEGENKKDAAHAEGICYATFLKHVERLGIKVRPRLAARAPVTITPPTDPADLGYLAAMIDGEGYICRWLDKRDRINFRVGVTNTDVRLMEWFEGFGGRRGQRGRNHGTFATDRPCYDWQVSARRDVLALLCAVAPYMRLKRDKAVAAIAELRAMGL